MMNSVSQVNKKQYLFDEDPWDDGLETIVWRELVISYRNIEIECAPDCMECKYFYNFDVCGLK